jgi:predicted DNA-binding protein with PD1-like motif
LIVRLEAGEPIVATLESFLRAQRADFASITAAGAVESICLSYWDPVKRAYQSRDFPEQLEVVSFEGNSSLKDGQPFLHIHGVFGRSDFSTIGGHIVEGRVNPTLEVWLRTESASVRRVHDQATGLELLDLPSRPAAQAR